MTPPPKSPSTTKAPAKGKSQAALITELRRVTSDAATKTARKEEIIRALRHEHKMSLRDIAALTDTSHTGVSRICGETV